MHCRGFERVLCLHISGGYLVPQIKGNKLNRNVGYASPYRKVQKAKIKIHSETSCSSSNNFIKIKINKCEMDFTLSRYGRTTICT
jgi:hypothetical protein